MAEAAPDFELLPFRRLIDDAAMRRWRKGVRPILPPFALLAGVLVLAFQVGHVTFLGKTLDPEANPLDLLTGLGPILVLGLVWMILYLLLYGIFKVRVIRYLLGRQGGFGAATRTLLQPAVIGTALLSAMVTTVGYVFCILPGIYLSIVFSFVLPVVLAEGHTGGAALGRSLALARYNPSRELLKSPVLKILAIYVIGWLLATVIGMVIQLPGMLIFQLMTFRQIAQGDIADPAAITAASLWITVPGQVINAIAQLAVKLYVDLTVVLLYFDVRHRKEGGDLEQALERLERRGGSAPPTSPGGDLG